MHVIHWKICETVAGTLPEKFELKKKTKTPNHHHYKQKPENQKKHPYGVNKVIFAILLSTLDVVPTFIS